MKQKEERLSIEVKLLDRCNLACRHCVNRDGPEKVGDLDEELFVRRLEEWTSCAGPRPYGLKEVRLTGGEPLLRFDAVLRLGQGCRRLGIATGINTNGLLLNESRIERLKEHDFRIMKVSFDGIEKSVYAGDQVSLSQRRRLIRMVEKMVRLGFKVILRFTLSRANRDLLRACYLAAADLGIYKFQVKPLIRAGRALDLDLALNRLEVNAALRDLAETAVPPRPPLAVLCWPPIGNTGFEFKGCGSSDKIYVSTSMVITICNYAQPKDVPPLGDLSQETLMSVLKKRKEGAWADLIGGYIIPRGCPNSDYFLQAT